MMNNTIQAGQILTARSAFDYNAVFQANVISRKGQFATVYNGAKVCRVKVKIDDRGEFVMALGRYSFAPVFRCN
jgi:hypothetical protein